MSANARRIDPAKTTVEVDGRKITLAELAAARDYVRVSHLALDPYPMVDLEVRESGAGKGSFTVTGHASVYNRWSLDLGGFREQVAPGFFDAVLERSPDVHALWDHDTRLALGRTKNNTLELRSDEVGLYNWIRVAPTTFAADLRVLMERGDIDQESFSFSVAEGGDEWEFDEDSGVVSRTLLPNGAADLYDVTITAAGAYPQTTAEVSRSIRRVLGTDKKLFAIADIRRLPGSEEPEGDAAPAEEDAPTRDAAPAEEDADGNPPSQEGEGSTEETDTGAELLAAQSAERLAFLKDLRKRVKKL